MGGCRTRSPLDTEVARHRHKPRHLSLQAAHRQCRLTLLHIQRGRNRHRTDRHRHRTVLDVRLGVVEGHTHRGRTGAGEPVAQAQIDGPCGLQRQLLIPADHQRHRGLAHTRPHQSARRQRGRGLVGHDQQFILSRRRPRCPLDTEITRKAHKARHLGLQAGDHQGRLTVLHIQRRRHRHSTDRHGHRAVHNVRAGVVERHAHARGARTGEAIAQAQVDGARGLQRQLLIPADHQRHRGLAHTRPHQSARRQRGRGLIGHDQQFILSRRRSRGPLDTEITRQAHKARNLRLQTGDHQGRLTVLHVQRRRHRNLTHRHRHGAIHDVRSGVVEDHTHPGRTGAGETVAQAQVDRARGLQRQLLIPADHQGHRGLAHTRPDQGAGRQRGGRLIRHDQQFVLVCGRTRRLLDAEITGQAHEVRHLRLQAGDHQGHLTVLHIQWRRHRDTPDRHGHRAIHDVGPGVVEGHAHPGRTGTGESIAQAQIGRARGLQRQLLITADHQRHRGLTHTRADQRARRQRGRRLIRDDQQFVIDRGRTRRLLDAEIARDAHEARHLSLQAGDHQRRLAVLHVQRCGH